MKLIRNLKRDNILIVANNIGGLKEQIKSGVDGILVDLNNLEEAKNTILKYFNNGDIKRICDNGYKVLTTKYDFYKIANKFIDNMIGEN